MRFRLKPITLAIVFTAFNPLAALHAQTPGTRPHGAGAKQPTAHGVLTAPSFQVLHAFRDGTDGALPLGNLIQDAKGNFYGTGSAGGDSNNGLVFKISPGGAVTELYAFTGGADGGLPYAGLVQDAAGNLYGTTLLGGAYGGGVVFKLSRSGEETVLHDFAGGNDGWMPSTGLVRDAAGDLFGTTDGGGGTGCSYGLGCGIVFELDPEGQETVLYSFSGGADGAHPYSTLIEGPDGALYGTAFSGGDLSCGQAYGCGTVFKVDMTGSLTVLHMFAGGTDGANPEDGLIRDAKGNLYGTTSVGGVYFEGVIFRVSPSGKESVLYAFKGAPDGAQPQAGLILDSAGNFYGTTVYGGLATCTEGLAPGCGVVFELSSTGQETVLHRFSGFGDGANPDAALIQGGPGTFYGTAVEGGAFGWGTFFVVRTQ